MTIENENNKDVVLNDLTNSPPDTALNVMELFNNSSQLKDSKVLDPSLVGKLEFTDSKLPANEKITNVIELVSGFEKKMEMTGKIPENLEKAINLTGTEKLLLDKMNESIKTGNIDQVQDMLRTLAENPKSVDRVLTVLNRTMQQENFLNSARWEQGRDNRGNEFIRLHLNHNDSASKSSGGTEVTIGSDGRNSAVYRGSWDSKPSPENPGKALQLFMPTREPYIKRYDK